MSEKEINTYILPSGAHVYIETMREQRRGTIDISKKIDQKTALLEVIEPLGELSELLFNKLKSSVTAPDTITLEFSALIKGRSNLLIVSGEGEGSFKVTLTWKSNE